MWPPGYYILRDRLPFFLTIIYLYKHKAPRNLLTAWGWYLTLLTIIATGAALGLYLKGMDMEKLAGIHWSAPSPIQWGSLIIATTGMLYSRKIPIFDAYYLSLLTAMAGGWLYEFTPLLFQGNFRPMIFFKVNAVKVFFVEFQVLCLPILLYLIHTTKQYKPSRLLAPTALIYLAFYGLNKYIIQWVQANLIYTYCWYVRLPAILFLFTLVYGIKGEKQHIQTN